MVGAPKFKGTMGIEYAFGWKPAGRRTLGALRLQLPVRRVSGVSSMREADYQNSVRCRHTAWLGSHRTVALRQVPAWCVTTAEQDLDITLTLDNAFDSKGSNWVIHQPRAGYADQFGDPRYHNMQAQFRPQNIGLTIRKKLLDALASAGLSRQRKVGVRRLVASSVVRGSHKGESHGGVYLIDLHSREVVQSDRLEHRRHRLAGPGLGPRPARHRLRWRAGLHGLERRAVRLHAGFQAASAPGAAPT